MRTSTTLDAPENPAAGGLRLENNANNSSADRRRRRYLARSGLWRHSTNGRCRKCGRASRLDHGGVEVRMRDGHGGLAGLVSCGSVWLCPVCNAKIMQRRAVELGSLIAAAAAQGVVMAEMTLTLRHSQGDALADLWGAVSTCWDRAKSGRQWLREADAHGLLGWLRVVEVTHGANGWHPHVHAVLFFRALDDDALDALAQGMFDRWRRAAVRLGLDAPLPVGQEWHRLDLDGGSKIAEYVTAAKGYDGAGAVGLELTHSQSKRARSAFSTRSTWQLLDEANDGEVPGLWQWREFERASHGKRQISYSRGLRELFGVDVEDLTDEEIADLELGTADDTGLVITRAGWSRMVGNPDWIPDALTVLERDGWAVLAAWLRERGVEFVEVAR